MDQTNAGMNYTEMRTKLATMRWEKEMAGKNVNETWEYFKSVLNEMISAYVPERKRRKGGGRPKWMDKELEKMIEKKNK